MTPAPSEDARCRVALLLVDVINDLEFEGGETLLAHARPMAEAIAALARRARADGVPVVYVNDNFGRWRSDFRSIVAQCTKEGVRGAPVARRLAPEESDYFVLKPMHSGFYETTLDTLLVHLGVEAVVVTGMAADYCVLFTANDAFMRGYGVVVPADCTAAEDPAVKDQVVTLVQRVLKADIRPSRDLDWDQLLAEGGDAGRAEPPRVE